VRFFRIETTRGELVGQFYLDLYARDHKQGGAWQGDARSRARPACGAGDAGVLPHLQFLAPGRRQAGHVQAREVLTLFHEFGHGCTTC